MDVPNVRRDEYTLVNIDDGFLNLMTTEGKTTTLILHIACSEAFPMLGAEKNDVKVPEGEVGDQIEKDFEDGKELIVSIVSAWVFDFLHAYSSLTRLCY